MSKAAHVNTFGIKRSRFPSKQTTPTQYLPHTHLPATTLPRLDPPSVTIRFCACTGGGNWEVGN